MRLNLIIPNKLPVPSTKGGAVEQLATWYIEQNEIYHFFDIHLYSIYDKSSKKLSKKYVYCKFHYIYCPQIFEKVFYKLRMLFNRIFKKNINCYLYSIILYILLPYDSRQLYLVESSDAGLVLFENKVHKNQIIGHLHGVMNGTITMSNKFGKFIVPSEYVKKFFLKDSIINHELVVVLKNCINEEKFSNTKKSDYLRKKYQLNKNDYIITFCGRLVEEKGILHLIKAFNRLNRENIKLLIIGSSNFGNNSNTDFEKKLFIESKKNKNIIFIGYIDNNLLPDYYVNSDLIVMPSIAHEAAGMVGIEAITSNSCLLTTNDGGIPEYVSEYAIIVDTQNLEENLYIELSKFVNKKYSHNSKEKISEFSRYYSRERYAKELSLILKGEQK